MRFIPFYIIGLFLLTSCIQTKNKKTEIEATLEKKTITRSNTQKNSDSTGGVQIITTGPRGGSYLGSKGEEFRYAVFRIQIINDTIIPINLEFKLPSNQISLLPDSTVALKVFLIPEQFTPNSIKDTFNFGVRMEELFESGNNQQFVLETSIQPEVPLIVFIGILFESQLMNGITRTQLFVEGHDDDAPFYPVKSSEHYDIDTNALNLYYGISFDPPNYYISLPCGQIRIN